MVDTNGHTPQINGNRNNRSARRSADSDAAFDQAKKTFLSHFKHFYALVFSAGFLLILTAAAGHLSLWVINESVTEQIWRVTLAAIGLGLLVTGVRVFAIENRPPPPKVIYPENLDPRVYGIEITLPSEDSKVDAPFSVKGTCKRGLPPGWHLWLILVPNGPKKNRLWPHACVTLAPPVKKKDKWSWNTTITTRIAKPGDGRTFGIYLAGPYGHVLLENHLKVCEDFSQGTRTLPLPDKTEDIILCGGYRSVTLDRVPGLPDSGDRAQPLVI